MQTNEQLVVTVAKLYEQGAHSAGLTGAAPDLEELQADYVSLGPPVAEMAQRLLGVPTGPQDPPTPTGPDPPPEPEPPPTGGIDEPGLLPDHGDRSSWERIPGKAYSDTIGYQKGTDHPPGSDSAIMHFKQIIEASPRAAVFCGYKGGGVFRQPIFDTIFVDDVTPEGCKWLFSGVGGSGELVRNVDFGATKGNQWEGHKYYRQLVLDGDPASIIEHCRIVNGNGNGIQEACRPAEVPRTPMDWTAEERASAKRIIRLNEIRNNCESDQRGSNQVAIYGTGFSLDILENLISCEWPESAWRTTSAGHIAKSAGGIWIEPEEPDFNAGEQVNPHEPGPTVRKAVWWRNGDWAQGDVLIHSNYGLLLRQPDRAMIFVAAVRSAVIGPMLVGDGNIDIDMSTHGVHGMNATKKYPAQLYTPKLSGDVVIQGLEVAPGYTPGVVRHRDASGVVRVLGPVTGTYRIQSGQVVEAKP